MTSEKKSMDEELLAIKKELPDLAAGFGSLFVHTMKDGALRVKDKELIALAIAVAQRCESCIRIHVEKCLAAGCARQEILESSAVAVLMQGGPAYTHIPIVIDALSKVT